jgi:drug/metabolite transporter (DMT)-like permease
MSTSFALVATILTSFLPICTKYLLRDARPAMVAWIVNAASLPLLALGTFVVTQCTLGVPFAQLVMLCWWHPLHFDSVFVLALLLSAVLNWAATRLSTKALDQADASLVSPLLTFNPAFTLFLALFALGEIPGVRETLGVIIILIGSYLLEVEQAQTSIFAPFLVLIHTPGVVLAVLASALWGTTTVLEKLAIRHLSPPSGPLVALLGTGLLVVLLTPSLWLERRTNEHSTAINSWRGIQAHPRAFMSAIVLSGIAPLFGFTAIALGLVGYATALFKLSSVLTILWAQLFLGETNIRQRFIGALVMLVGGLLIAV